MRILRATDRESILRLVVRDAARRDDVTRQAATIVNDVRARGDRALLEWTAQLVQLGS